MSILFLAVTIYEQFTYTLNTVLSDIAAKFSQVRDVVIQAQIKFIEELTDEIIDFYLSTIDREDGMTNGSEDRSKGLKQLFLIVC